MVDNVGTVRPGPNFEFHLRLLRLLNSSGNKSLADEKLKGTLRLLTPYGVVSPEYQLLLIPSKT